MKDAGYEKEVLTQKLRKILCFQDHNEKLDFEAEMLHLDIMHQVKILMAEYGMNKNLLAEKLNISNDYLSELFSGDELVNLKLLAKFQRIFTITTKFRWMINISYNLREIYQDATLITEYVI